MTLIKSRLGMVNNKKQNLRLEYPCSWIYKVIGADQDEMQSAVHDIIRDRPCRIS
ncbi:MAG TPA: hypothetical protein DIW05_10150, partial [Syntrophaceae bacterium]|nr:hypothetical protein [Syntrophaceae bacterium]